MSLARGSRIVRQLFHAVAADNEEGICAAVAAGADVNACDQGSAAVPDSCTPLMRAAFCNHAQSIRTLLALGAAVDAAHTTHRTALHWAVINMQP